MVFMCINSVMCLTFLLNITGQQKSLHCMPFCRQSDDSETHDSGVETMNFSGL